MPNSQFHTAISEPRYLRYLTACGNREKALKLYRANISLSQQLYGVIGVFEVILRNSIDRHMITIKGKEWLEDAVASGGYLDIGLGCEYTFHSVQEAIQKLGQEYTHDRLIAKLTLGFWTYQFASKEFAAAGSKLLEIFPNRPFGIRQKQVFQSLIKINDIRNRVAHHEPVCFEKNVISTDRTEKRYGLILELLGWLGCDQQQILYEIDEVKEAIMTIGSIKQLALIK